MKAQGDEKYEVGRGKIYTKFNLPNLKVTDNLEDMGKSEDDIKRDLKEI
jgi:hypothetical protein